MDINKIIYEVRGRRVILVKDVAKLFDMDTKRINEIVKRNIDKFSNENYFQLTKEEYKICVYGRKFATLNDDFATLNNVKISRGNNLKYLPFVFTIDGIKVLKRVLKSKEMDVIFNKIIEALEEESTALIVPSSQEFREENIKSMIYEIRGKQVMFDFDLAVLYECKNGAKTINQAVERNKERFPNDFYFQLTDDEKIKLRSQSGTANMSRSNSYVFTEQGVAMLASVLRTSIAAKISIRIMRTFVAMHKYISNDLIEQKYINNLVLEDHDKIALLQESFSKFEEKKKASEIYFNGQIYECAQIRVNNLVGVSPT